METAESRIHQCADCRKHTPVNSANYTLITCRYGWRLTHGSGRDGRKFVEWRCPSCWSRFMPVSLQSVG